jgi:acid phosphatase (class A)
MSLRGFTSQLLPAIGFGVLACAASGQTPVADPDAPDAAPSRTEAAPPARSSYLIGNAVDFAAVLPPAPQNGDARDQADRRIFLATRALQGTPRWQMAADDADLGTAAMLRHFSCSLDIGLTPQQAPRLVALLQQATREAAQSMARAKDFYKRQRPFLVDQGPTCVSPDTVGNSYDYPSGHTTAGWTWALVLAQVDPPHAVPILARGRAIGDSRVVCGMHNASAVEGSLTLTSAVLAAAAGSPAFQSDLAAARSELLALRSAPHSQPEAARCAAEAELVRSYW